MADPYDPTSPRNVPMEVHYIDCRTRFTPDCNWTHCGCPCHHPKKEVLDHGQLILIDSMAGDKKVYGAARVSTGKAWQDASKGKEEDDKLIRFLMKNGHGTPFEHAVFQFFVKAPIFVFREWQRHRIGSYNEQSGRYSRFQAEFYFPDHVRGPDPKNKQSTVRLDDEALFEIFEAELNTTVGGSYDAYERLIDQGVGKEMARILLPVNLYSRMWWTVNARSLMNFIQLRTSPAAQWEIQEYAKRVEEWFQQIMPVTHDAFVESGRVAP